MGLPGSGKTTVAERAAALLHAPWVDLDERIASAARRTIPDIFASLGEPAFRGMERAAMRAALDDPPQVIAAGGGWAAEPGNIAESELRALLIYLSIAPADAWARIAGSSGRPLLEGDDNVRIMEALLARREAWYRLAAIEVAVGRSTPDTAAAAVATAARQYGGW